MTAPASARSRAVLAAGAVAAGAVAAGLLAAVLMTTALTTPAASVAATPTDEAAEAPPTITFGVQPANAAGGIDQRAIIQYDLSP